MNAEDAGTEGAPADPAFTTDLRLRLQGSQIQQSAARAEARRLARELVLTRRLLRFSLDGLPSSRRTPLATSTGPRRAARLTEPVLFHLDTCERQGAHTIISGWAFRPVSAWDARAATVTLIFRAGTEAYVAETSGVPRPDVAAHFAAQAEEASGGAEGLDGAGFRSEIVNASLPTDVDLEIVLRLECAGIVCEQSTGRRVRF